MIRFMFTPDLHYGFERRGGHKIALHDMAAWEATLEFAQDFKPHVWILGGDILDCGCISHHNHGKPGQTEGLKLLADAQGCIADVIKPVEGLAKDLYYIIGNHEAWLGKLTDIMPSLEGIIDLQSILKLGKRWEVIPQGGLINLGKLTFIHGDTVKGGEHVAKAAVINYERSVRFGHFHTAQCFSKGTPIDAKLYKTGWAVPCLCTRNPGYAKGTPNRWVQGFNFGYVEKDGSFFDYVPIIINGRTVINGRVYGNG